MKAKAAILGLAVMVMLLSLSTNAFAYVSTSLQSVRADRSGISGQFGVSGISQNFGVYYYCYLYKQGAGTWYAGAGSAGSGPGYHPFWCRMPSQFPGQGNYAAVIYVSLSGVNPPSIQPIATNWYYVP